jgi:DNA-binding LytR/AlgR family response regulator
VRKGADQRALPVDAIAWATSEHKLTFVVDREGTRFLADPTLQELEATLDPARFFRVNRQILVSIDAVARFRSVGKGRLRLELDPAAPFEVVVPQERAARFRAWLTR